MIPPRLLTDTLTIGGVDVPAYVGTVTVATDWNGNLGTYQTTDATTAIVAVGTVVAEGDTATWRGDDYLVSGVLTRRRPTGPDDHHVTLRLTRTTNT